MPRRVRRVAMGHGGETQKAERIRGVGDRDWNTYTHI